MKRQSSNLQNSKWMSYVIDVKFGKAQGFYKIFAKIQGNGSELKILNSIVKKRKDQSKNDIAKVVSKNKIQRIPKAIF